TTNSEEINEKVSLAGVSSDASTAQPPTEDEKAMALLVDVANAALASSPNLVARPVLVDAQPVPPKVNDVLGEMWDEISKELRAKKLVRGTLSRASTPPPTVSISRPESEDEDSIVEKIRMPKHLAIPIQRARSPLYQKLFPSETTTSEFVAGSPAMSYVTAQISPATSFVTAIERGSTPLPVEEGRAPIVDLGSSPPLPYYSLPSSPRRHLASAPLPRPASPQPPGALVMYDYENDDARENVALLPPAHITQTALNLALTLPATEWVFQFIVVFIGWFGFWMQPLPSQTRRRR
ncbi:4123_t:CDS:1, partial [Acaulospora colombiana]